MAKRATIMSDHAAGPPRRSRRRPSSRPWPRDVWPLVDAGAHPPGRSTVELPMAQAAEAHRIMAASTHTGKLVLRAE